MQLIQATSTCNAAPVRLHAVRLESTRRTCLGRPLASKAPPAQAATLQRHSRGAVLVRASGGRDDLSDKLGGLTKTASGVVDTVVDIIPESVPRSTARLGVIAIGSLIVFSLVQKILSTAITLAVIGAAGYFFYNSSGMGGGSSSGEDIDAGDSDDPVANAKKIMDKYK